MTLTILCAGALRPALETDPTLPAQRPPDASSPPLRAGSAASRLLSRANRGEIVRPTVTVDEPIAHESGDEAWLRSKFSVAERAAVAAAAACEVDGTPRALLLRPVHLHAGLDHLTLDPPEQLALSEPDSQSLHQAACEWLDSEPVRLRRLSTHLWELVEIDPERTRFAELRAASSSRASGRNIDVWLPRGPSARNWRRLMNDVQMLWHTHPVNADRELDGLKPVNALWLEGGVPVSASRPFATIFSNDSVLRGLAKLGGADVDDFDADCGDALEREPAPSLIDLPFWRTALADGTGPAWRQAWEQFERWVDLIESVSPSSRSRRWEIVLTGDHSARTFDLSPAMRWRLWRRSVSAQRLLDSPADGL